MIKGMTLIINHSDQKRDFLWPKNVNRTSLIINVILTPASAQIAQDATIDNITIIIAANASMGRAERNADRQWNPFHIVRKLYEKTIKFTLLKANVMYMNMKT